MKQNFIKRICNYYYPTIIHLHCVAGKQEGNRADRVHCPYGGPGYQQEQFVALQNPIPGSGGTGHLVLGVDAVQKDSQSSAIRIFKIGV